MELGAAEYGLVFHRLNQILTLSDGRILAADEGASRLFIFSSGGELLEERGRAGFGPGEFQSIAGVAESEPGTIAVFDYVIGRITYFDCRGEVTESLRLAPLEMEYTWVGSYRLSGYTSGGEAVFAPWSLPVWPNPLAGVVRSSLPIIRYDGSDWSPVESPVHWARELWSDGRMQFDLPFGSHDLVISTGDRFYGVNGSGETVVAGTTDGGVLYSHRLPLERPVVTAEAIEHHIQQRLAGARDRAELREGRALLESIPFPETAPLFDAIVAAQDHSVWLRYNDLWNSDDSASQRTWLVLDELGIPAATVETPKSLEIHEIRDDQVLGIWTDTLGVQTVRRYTIHRDSVAADPANDPNTSEPRP